MLAYGSAVEELKLAAHPTLYSQWLTPLLLGFSKAYPNVHLDIRDNVAFEIRSRPTHWQQYFLVQELEISESFTGSKFDTFYACIAATEGRLRFGLDTASLCTKRIG